MSLRFLCFGAGAIGTYLGGSLSLAGYPVVFVERPALAEELRTRGLSLKVNGETRRILQPQVVGSLDQALALGPFDLAVFAVKAYDTASALEGMRAWADQLPSFICLQNGVENEEKIAALLGPQRVLTATVTSAVGRQAAGNILLERLRGVGVAQGHPLSVPLVQALDAAGLRPRLYPDAAGLKWSKMLTNLLANASSAILNLPPDQVFAHPGLFELEVRQVREALAVMRAMRIPLTDLPGTPVRLLAWMFSGLPLGLARPLMRRTLGKGRGGKMPSFYIDLQSGSGKSEVDYLNGAVVRFGERLGLPVPVNRLLTQTLLGIVRGELPRAAFDHHPEELLSRLDG